MSLGVSSGVPCFMTSPCRGLRARSPAYPLNFSFCTSALTTSSDSSDEIVQSFVVHPEVALSPTAIFCDLEHFQVSTRQWNVKLPLKYGVLSIHTRTTIQGAY